MRDYLRESELDKERKRGQRKGLRESRTESIYLFNTEGQRNTEFHRDWLYAGAGIILCEKNVTRFWKRVTFYRQAQA